MGWIIAGSNSIYKTTDGGTTWEYKDQGGNNPFALDAILVTPLIAYSIGQYQSKRTIDGGNTWTPCDFSGTGYSGKGLFALDEDNIYFAGLKNFFLEAAIGKLNNTTWNITDFSNDVLMANIFFYQSREGLGLWI